MSRSVSHLPGSRVTSGSPAAPSQRSRRRSRRNHGNYGYVFGAPFLLCFLLLFVLPLGYAAYLSLFKNQLVGGNRLRGTEQLQHRALTDGQFIAGVGRVALFFVMQVPVMLLLALLAALAIDSGLPACGAGLPAGDLHPVRHPWRGGRADVGLPVRPQASGRSPSSRAGCTSARRTSLATR